MSIELKEAAQQALNALDEATTYTGSPSWSPSMTDECIAAASALRTALSQQPAAGEPVARVDYSERGNIAWLFGPQLPDGAELFKRPAPSVPDDVVRDAERYRFIRDADVSDDLIPDIALYAMESLDEYIDAARLAAKEGGA